MRISKEPEDFTNYNDTSGNYDTGRQPVGIELMRAFCQGKDVLEVGVGTGNNLAAVVNVATSVTRVDRSSGMLDKEVTKIRGYRSTTIG